MSINPSSKRSPSMTVVVVGVVSIALGLILCFAGIVEYVGSVLGLMNASTTLSGAHFMGGIVSMIVAFVLWVRSTEPIRVRDDGN